MVDHRQPQFSRRERQIMEIIYRGGEATVADVLDAMHDPPSYSAVRALLNLLEDKGHLRHKQVGRKYVYVPTVAREKARRSALHNLLQTFFDGSVEQVVTTLLGLDEKNPSDDELKRLSKLIEQAKKEGRSS